MPYSIYLQVYCTQEINVKWPSLTLTWLTYIIILFSLSSCIWNWCLVIPYIFRPLAIIQKSVTSKGKALLSLENSKYMFVVLRSVSIFFSKAYLTVITIVSQNVAPWWKLNDFLLNYDCAIISVLSTSWLVEVLFEFISMTYSQYFTQFRYTMRSNILWSLGMDKDFLYNGCNYLSKLRLKWIHASKMGLCNLIQVTKVNVY